jgi:GNAT superfamily N-acetyltransferase
VNSEQRTANSEQRTANSEQRTANSEQRTENRKPTMELTYLTAEDTAATADLLHRALVAWYEKNLRQGARFGDSPDPFQLFPQVYEALDPGQCIAVKDPATGRLLGVCFTHDRPTHLAIGIVATCPDHSSNGLAKRMMQEALQRAQTAGKPARLVSSLLNLDSFSLYNRLGFIPQTIYQDLLFTVPTDGIPLTPPALLSQVRPATLSDATAIAALEHRHQHIHREKDHRFFLENKVGTWQTWVLEHPEDSSLRGFIVTSLHPAFSMIGPGFAIDDETALALIWTALHAHSGGTTVLLVPSQAQTITSTLYSWGGRNIELHVSQTTHPTAPTTGHSFPTFLPESA